MCLYISGAVSGLVVFVDKLFAGVCYLLIQWEY